MLLYLDETGCLGFDFSKSGTSRYLTIAVLACDGRSEFTSFKKAVNRTLKNKINRRRKKRPVSELKASSTSIEVKRYFMKNAPNAGWKVYGITINKQNAMPHLTTKEGKVKLYNHLASALLKKIPFKDDGQPVTLVLDKSKSKSEIADFNQYFERQTQGRLPINTPLYIHHEDSQSNPCLQAVDLFCWGIVRNRSRNDSLWITEYREYVKEDILYF
jgi:hypothetical protein